MPTALVLLLAISEAAAAHPPPAAAAELRLILVRHAEAGGDGADPSLSPAGRQRADCLAEALAREPLTHVFASPFRRTRETVTAIAAARELTVTVRDPLPASPLAAEIAALPPGSVALLAGHSNTLPALVAALGGSLSDLVTEQGQPALPRDEHDRIVLLRLAPEAEGPPRLVELLERRQPCPAPSGP